MHPDNSKIIKDKVLNFLCSMNTQANYVNVPGQEPPRLFSPLQNHPRHQHHHHTRHASSTTRHGPNNFHSRSQSQHHYNTMSQQPEYINYYNIAGPTIGPANRSAQASPPPLFSQPSPQRRVQLDSMTVMRLGVELGVPIDAAPKMPPRREYSISKTPDGYMYKILYPQTRIMATDVNDPDVDIHIRKGEPVMVLGPSREDRSNLTICHKERHIDIPHQYTQKPPVSIDYPNWPGCLPDTH